MSRDGSSGGVLAGIARSGVVAVLLHPLSTVTTVACLVAMLAPFLAAAGVARGVAEQAADAVLGGADVYVGAERFGRPAPVPLAAVEAIRAMPSVLSAEPRIVGSIVLGADRTPALLVGVAGGTLPSPASLVEGRLWSARDEVVVGSELARALALRPGSTIPPFYRNDAGERPVRVVGVFRSGVPMWQAHLVVTSLETAQTVFAEPGAATQVLVRCPPAYRAALRDAIARLPSLAAPGEPPLRPRVTTLDETAAFLARRTRTRDADFTAQYLLAFAVGVPLVLATTGLGLGERRREVGLLKAVGWRTDEIVLRSLVESAVLAVLGFAGAALAVWAWVRLAGAAGVARLFLPDADAVPGFEVPFRWLPEPLLLAGAVAVVVTTTGSLWASWRAAQAAPAEAIR